MRKVARIEEVNRIIEVLNSIGVKTKWLKDNDLEITPPARLRLEDMDVEAAKKTRTVLMFLGHYFTSTRTLDCLSLVAAT